MLLLVFALALLGCQTTPKGVESEIRSSKVSVAIQKAEEVEFRNYLSCISTSLEKSKLLLKETEKKRQATNSSGNESYAVKSLWHSWLKSIWPRPHPFPDPHHQKHISKLHKFKC